MEIHSLNKIVTSFFLVFEHPDDRTVRLRAGLDLLAATLVRAAAHKIYIPYDRPRFGPPIEETIKQYPPSLAGKIEIVDKDKELYNKVSTYLRPIREEVKETPLILAYNSVSDFLYKLVLACEFQAEADVSEAIFVGSTIDALRDNIKDEEARSRLDGLYGVYSLYQKPEKIDALTILPEVPIPSIYQRISDLLDDAEIIELSKNRYFLGFPSKAKAALIRIQRWGRNVLMNRKYMNYIKATTDLIQVASTSAGLPVPSGSMPEILRNILASPYNPPLIDLDYFRVKICRSVSPSHFPNFIMPDGATRAVTEEYFHKYYGIP